MAQRIEVVVHQDDVGMNHGANAAFAELSDLGICTAGSVMGVYLLDELYRENEIGAWCPLPGTAVRTSVSKSPGWFGGSGTFVSGMDCRKQTGVVMELAVRG